MDQPYNILLFGETGVGKSTFINACENYIKFSTLDEALQCPNIYYTIPIKFDWPDPEEDGNNLITIEEGHDPNENISGGIGDSVTQNMKAHTFHYNNEVFRFYDTPGLNDTRGHQIEIVNIQNILKFMKLRLKHINAVCILLKADENRKSIQLRYTVLQFLKLLHKDLAENLIFLFTHSMTTNFRMGNIRRILESLFEDVENILGVRLTMRKEQRFFVDNNCFNYLIAVKLDKDTVDDKDNYAVSWNISATNCYKLLDYITTLPVKSIQGILDINYARIEIEDMYFNQLKEIKKKRQEYITQSLDQRSIIKRCEEYINILVSKRFKIDITIRKGPYHMICYNKKCIKEGEYGINGMACCANCVAWWKAICDAFRSGKCQYCSCSVDDHDFLHKRQFEETRKRENSSILEMIDREKVALADHKKTIAEIETKILSSFRSKEDIVEKIRTKIDFLERNCIIIFNKDLMEYLNVEISTATESKKQLLNIYVEQYKTLHDLYQNCNELIIQYGIDINE